MYSWFWYIKTCYTQYTFLISIIMIYSSKDIQDNLWYKPGISLKKKIRLHQYVTNQKYVHIAHITTTEAKLFRINSLAGPSSSGCLRLKSEVMGQCTFQHAKMTRISDHITWLLLQCKLCSGKHNYNCLKSKLLKELHVPATMLWALYRSLRNRIWKTS